MTEKGRDKAVRFLMNARPNLGNYWYFPEVYVAGDAVYPVRRAAQEWAEQSFFNPARVEVVYFEDAYMATKGAYPSKDTISHVAFLMSEIKARRIMHWIYERMEPAEMADFMHGDEEKKKEILKKYTKLYENIYGNY